MGPRATPRAPRLRPGRDGFEQLGAEPRAAAVRRRPCLLLGDAARGRSRYASPPPPFTPFRFFLGCWLGVGRGEPLFLATGGCCQPWCEDLEHLGMLSADIGTRLVVFVFFLFFFFPLWRALRGGEVKRGKTFCFLQAPCYFYSGFLQIFFFTLPPVCARVSPARLGSSRRKAGIWDGKVPPGLMQTGRGMSAQLQ